MFQNFCKEKKLPTFATCNKTTSLQMKLRILNIISCLFVAACVITSCLEKEEYEYELSSNSSITAFSINDIFTKYTKIIDGKDSIMQDTVLGANYPFTIDQRMGVIYNADSLPKGTDVSKVKVDITADTHGIFIVASADSLWEEEDSLNFEKPIQFKVLSETGVFGRIYVAKINVHKQIPDSMVWTKINTNFPATIVKQKAVFTNNQIFVFAEQASQVAVSSMDVKTHQWTALQAIDIPTKAEYSSVKVWDNQFYMLAQNQLYTSSNGVNWNKVETEQKFNQLTACISTEKLHKIIGINTKNQYIESIDGINWEVYEAMPEEFPTQNISFAAYPLSTNAALGRIVVVGDNNKSGNGNLAWTQLTTDNGWTDLNFDTNQLLCPRFENPSMIHYNNQLYAFGGAIKGEKDSKAFSHFYSSIDNGITWEKQTKLVMFPSEFSSLYEQAKGNYSWAIDQNNFLWIMWSQTGEVWKGRINKLGFDKK